MTQAVDTGLNGPAKARYTALEAAAMIRLMRDGVCVPVCVPQLRPEECVDIMVDVLSDMSAHHAAADGYVKIGLRVSLDDSSQGHHVVREAGIFWKELDMRSKVNSAVAEVREEVAEGRLTWSYNDIRRLIQPYPKRSVDVALGNLGEDTSFAEGYKQYASDEKESDSEGREDMTHPNGATRAATMRSSGAPKLRRASQRKRTRGQRTRCPRVCASRRTRDADGTYGDLCRSCG